MNFHDAILFTVSCNHVREMRRWMAGGVFVILQYGWPVIIVEPSIMPDYAAKEKIAERETELTEAIG